MIDFVIDGMLSGTGIRDGINGGYVAPHEIGLSPLLSSEIATWQRQYEDAH